MNVEDAWQRTFDALPDLISIHDTEHRIVRINKAMADRLGMAPEQAVGEPCFIHVHGTDAPPPFCPHCLLLKDGREHVSELHEDRLGGDFIVSVTPIFDDAGKVQGSVHLARDITKRKRAEEALRESEKRYRSLFNDAVEMIHEVDTEGRIIDVNDTELRVMGYTREECVGKRSIELVHPERREATAVAIKSVLSGETVAGYETVLVTKDGRPVMVEINATPRFEGSKVVSARAIFRDITERKRMLDRLARQNKELEEAARLKADFVNMAIHDFGSPLTVIRGYVDMMKDGIFGKVTEKQQDTLSRIAGAEEALAGLRADMLELAKFEQGKMRLELAPVSLREVVSSGVEELESLAQDKGQEIAVDVADVTAECDQRRIRQVVRNLLSNAIRYTGVNGRIRISARAGEDGVVVSVSDNGRGIVEEDIERIFTGFYRSGERLEGSTGLGLVVVRTIVEAHGGRVWCESKLGTGSTFHFTLPVRA